MCSNCSGDYQDPDATANVQLCECGHDVELHDSCGCQVVSRTFRCTCTLVHVTELRHSIDTETFRCECGKLMCGSCGGCSGQCKCPDKEIR